MFTLFVKPIVSYVIKKGSFKNKEIKFCYDCELNHCDNLNFKGFDFCWLINFFYLIDSKIKIFGSFENKFIGNKGCNSIWKIMTEILHKVLYNQNQFKFAIIYNFSPL